jgi:hypothetical protein
MTRAPLASVQHLRLAALFIAAGCALGCHNRHEVTLRIESIESPAGPGSQTPFLTRGANQSVLMSWVESQDGTHALRFARWREGAWSVPSQIATGADWFANWADFPTIAESSNGVLYAHWLRQSADAEYAYEVVLTRSTDQGQTWSTPIVAHTDRSPVEHGFVSLVPHNNGDCSVFWLDGRHLQSKEGDAAGATSLFHVRWKQDGTLSEESIVDPRVCDCCQTSAAWIEGPGAVVVYRNRSKEEEIRDIAYASQSEKGEWVARLLHRDGWRIDGCPVNGPAIAVDDRRFAIAWFTKTRLGDRPSVVARLGSWRGRPRGASFRVDDGAPVGRVSVAIVNHDTTIVSWLEQADDRLELRVRGLGNWSRWGESHTIAKLPDSRESGFPRMAAVDGSALLAWTEPGEASQVRVARVHSD